MQDWQAIASALGVAIGTAVGAVVKARADAKKAEKRMQAVPQTAPMPEPTVVELLTALDEAKRDRWLERYRREDAEQALRRLRDELQYQQEALSRERQAHAATAAHLEQMRVYARELERRARALDSGFTPLLAEPFELPARVVEEDDRTTLQPPKRRKM